MPVYELINPSDPYTFEAPNLDVAGATAVLLSPGFGAKRVDDDVDEFTPVFFGWQEWLDEHGIDKEWVAKHKGEVADALDSFLIGDVNRRQDVVDMLAVLPPEQREDWRARRQKRHRTSLNRIGEAAYKLAAQLRGNGDDA